MPWTIRHIEPDSFSAVGPSPGGHNPGRIRHRTNTVWTLRTVAAILAGRRYTERQAWNR